MSQYMENSGPGRRRPGRFFLISLTFGLVMGWGVIAIISWAVALSWGIE